jgi:adenosylcobyric acid synthase
MGFAELVDAPVILVADIDRGGVFAQLVGTMILLSESEQKRVKGYIINKFRGDVSLLEPGIDMVKPYLDIPCLGIVPHLEGLLIDDEDSVTDRVLPKEIKESQKTIGVLKYPHASNLSDFTPLEMESNIALHYITKPEEIEKMDAVILPGSKHTIHDLQWMKESGCFQAIQDFKAEGKWLLGICGGFQIFGTELIDPHKIESDLGREAGLGILEAETVLETRKTTCMSEIEWKDQLLKGYEIHQGVTHAKKADQVVMTSQNGEAIGIQSGRVIGTYLHGVLDNEAFRKWFLKENGVESDQWDYLTQKQKSYDRWAEHLKDSVDWPTIRQILFDSETV